MVSAILYLSLLAIGSAAPSQPSPWRAVFPAYPTDARVLGLEADFVVALRLGTTGGVTGVDMLEQKINVRFSRDAIKLLANPLADALKQWKYAPGQDGRQVYLHFKFVLCKLSDPEITIFNGSSEVEVRGRWRPWLPSEDEKPPE